MTVRVAAGRGLAQLASPAAVPALVATLEGTPAQEDAGLRQTVAIALGAIPVPEAVTALCDHLSSYKEPDPEIRALAAEGLALAPRVGSNAAQQAGRTLIGALSDSASEVRIAAAHSLGQMRFSGQLGEWVAQTLRMSQDDPHYWVRVAASEALH
jgi:HEAT repeat protein